jgi:hypothetical protein
MGLCIPMLEFRRLGLHQHSIHSEMALQALRGLPFFRVEYFETRSVRMRPAIDPRHQCHRRPSSRTSG